MDKKLKMTTNYAKEGQMVIVSSDGTAWYAGGSVEPGAMADDFSHLKSAVPPDVAASMKIASRNQVKRAPKQRASAKAQAEPIHMIFFKASECMDDPLWVDILKKMSRGVCRKGFRFYPVGCEEDAPSNLPHEDTVQDINTESNSENVSTLRIAGKLIYRAKTKDFTVSIPSVPEVAFRVVKEFIQKHASVISDADQVLANTAVDFVSSNPLDFLPKTWGEVRGSSSRNMLIAHFVKQIKEKYRLSISNTYELSAVVNLALSSGGFADADIEMSNGAIVNIEGLGMRVSDQTITIYDKLDEGITKLEMTRRHLLTGYVTTNKVEIETITTPSAPAAAFSQIVSAVEKHFTSESTIISNQLPGPVQVEKFAKIYSERAPEAWLAPFVFAAIGIMQQMLMFKTTGTNSLSISLKDSISTAIEVAEKTLKDEPDLHSLITMSEGCQKLSDVIVCEAIPQAIISTLMSNPPLANKEEITEYKRVIFEIVSKLFQKASGLDEEPRVEESSKHRTQASTARTIRKSTLLAQSAAERLLKSRRDTLKNIESEIAIIVQDVNKQVKVLASSSNGGIGKRGAAPKKWSRFLTQLEKRTESRRLEECGLVCVV
jgi:hypothetical protein